MTNTIFIVLTQILAAVIVFYTTDGIVNKKSKGQIFQKRRKFFLTPKGIVLSLVFIVIIAVSVIHDIDETKARKKEVENAKKQMDFKDSLNNVRIENSKLATIEALAKYGLKYDTVQRRIEQIVRDSSRTVIVNKEQPLLKLCPVNPIILTEDGLNPKIQISICNSGAVSRDIQLKFYFFISDINDDIDIYKNLQFFGEFNRSEFLSEMSASEFKGFTANIMRDMSNKNLFIYLVGSYSNSERSKVYLADDVVYFDFKEKKYYSPVFGKDKLRKILKEKGVY